MRVNSMPEALVVTKLGTGIDEQKKQVLGDELERGQVTAAIDSSLSRLQRDHIDVMLLHLNAVSVELATPVFEEMEKARTAGKLRAFGWSTDFPESAAHMSTMEGFICIEHAMSAFIDVPSIQKTVEQSNLFALIRSPLAMGILTGKFDEETKLPSDDARSLNNTRRDYFENGKVAAKYLDNLAAIREMLQSGGRTVSQGALAHGPLPDAVMLEIENLVQREPEGAPRAR